MSKSRRHLWTAARHNAELPDPPPGISEPRYAAMLFSCICFVSAYCSTCLVHILMQRRRLICRAVGSVGRSAASTWRSAIAVDVGRTSAENTFMSVSGS